MEMELIQDEQIQKKGRHRRKQLYNSILKQMEFYFGDSNLTKDRFLSQLINDNPYVDVSVFLQFNKIRKLTGNVDDITKALSKSELLELSEDKTKVKRTTPVAPKENVDDCTIYVERLKSDATHEWLASTFSEFGNVAYVSIPKYRHNGMVKGFAFVEFDDEESVKSAVEYFDGIGCKIPSCIEPQALCSIATYQGSEGKCTADDGDANPSKRKFDGDEDEVNFKKPRLADRNSSEEGEKGGKRKREEDEVPVDQADDNKKKKARKLHKKKMSFKEMGLQILPKKEWKKLRNRYLDMQRKAMQQLKQHLNKQRYAGNYNSTNTQDKAEKVTDSAPKVAFVPGTIVKVTLNEPCFEPKALKKEYKNAFPGIKYVDISSGNQEIYLRFNNNEAAGAFCSSASSSDRSILLEGDEETDYWKKIQEDMSAKQQKNTKTKLRGRDKLLKKAEQQAAKHIQFSTDDED